MGHCQSQAPDLLHDPSPLPESRPRPCAHFTDEKTEAQRGAAAWCWLFAEGGPRGLTLGGLGVGCVRGDLGGAWRGKGILVGVRVTWVQKMGCWPWRPGVGGSFQ